MVLAFDSRSQFGWSNRHKLQGQLPTGHRENCSREYGVNMVYSWHWCVFTPYSRHIHLGDEYEPIFMAAVCATEMFPEGEEEGARAGADSGEIPGSPGPNVSQGTLNPVLVQGPP